MSRNIFATANGGFHTDNRQAPGFLAMLSPSIFVHTLRKARPARRDYEHLLELPDYLLEDLGLTRSQVIAASRRRLF